MFKDLFQFYNEFHVQEIQTNRFQPERFNEVFDALTEGEEVVILGNSVEDRPIRMLRIGSGETKVLMWSQMHGNESTATRALLDIINLHCNPGRFKQQWQQILQNLCIYILPILNPDGTAKFKRRNALDIDLNRDARQFEAPESRILRDAIADISPDFSFNLHDQRRFYNIEGTAKPSTISFLAPAFDESESINDTRLAAMQLIAAMRKDLETVIPGQVGLYDDSYGPRAFGDYSQAQGASTLLIESGWENYDFEKEFVRKLNFSTIISGLDSICTKSYQSYAKTDYTDILMNDEKLFDVLIRNVGLIKNGKRITLDIGIEREEFLMGNTSAYYSKGIISDLGDLREWYGFEEVEGSDYLLIQGKVAEINFNQWLKLSEAEKVDYVKEGFLYLLDGENPENADSSGEIINYVSRSEPLPSLDFEGPANFLMINKAGDIKYIVLNGFLWPIHETPPERINGLKIN